MRSVIRLVVLPAVAMWLLFAAHQVWSYPSAAAKTGAACVACHANPAGGPALTEAGKAFAAKPATALPKDSVRAEFIGADKCRICHSKQYKAWKETKHAHALEGLEKATPEAAAKMAKALGVTLKAAPAKTADCVKCHVTGMDLPGGYPAADSVKNASLANVTCEACHGPGSVHMSAKAEEKKLTINGAATAKMCTQCHTPATSPKFDFATARAKGVHTVPSLGR